MNKKDRLLNHYKLAAGLGFELRFKNKIKPHATSISETTKHFTVKAILAFLLMRQGKDILCEVVFRNFKDIKPDVFDLDERIIYEVESRPQARTRLKKVASAQHPLIDDVIIVNLTQVPEDHKEMWKYLTALIKGEFYEKKQIPKKKTKKRDTKGMIVRYKTPWR